MTEPALDSTNKPGENLWPHPVGVRVGEQATDYMTITLLVTVVRRRWKWVAATTLLVALATYVQVLKRPLTYSASATFIPQSNSAPSSALSGIAAQFGVSATPADPMQSPGFYVDLLKSRAVLGYVVDSSRIERPRGAKSSVADALGVPKSQPVYERANAMAVLAGMIDVSVTRTNIINLVVQGNDPNVAAQLCRALLDAVLHFNREVRQTNASEERKFAEGQRESARAERDAAEDRLKQFLRENRAGESPDITYERLRLTNDLQRREDLYNSLSQAYERARLDEVRNAAVMTVIDQPEPPLEPDARKVGRRAALGIAAGLLLGLLIAFLADSFLQSDGLAALRPRQA